MVFVPRERLGPPPRSLAADAHDCIMVRMNETTSSSIPHRIQGCGAKIAHVMAGSPLIVLSEHRVLTTGRRRLTRVVDRRRPSPQTPQTEEQEERVFRVAKFALDNWGPIQGSG